jgi:fructosamine-3-kinase
MLSSVKQQHSHTIGEHTSLNAIHAIVPTFCPRSYAHGPTSSGHFLATDFLNLSSHTASGSTFKNPSSGMSFAAKLAKLHTTPAPIPDGYDKPMFGFPVTTCCGATEQDNTFRASWADFYADQRLRHILKACEKANGKDAELAKLLEATASHVVPRLLADGHLTSPSGSPITPVVVHGDLWSGNHGRGSIGASGVEEVVYDPSSSYSHSEFEMGIMKMFGGFRGDVKEYQALKPRDHPEEEYESRVELYELYHHLNHFALFGGSYREGAVAIMKKLNKKFGGDSKV